MTRLYIVLEQALAVVSQNGQGWKGEIQLAGNNTQCIAVDPLRPEYVYCGTFGQGLWRSRKSRPHLGAGRRRNNTQTDYIGGSQRG